MIPRARGFWGSAGSASDDWRSSKPSALRAIAFSLRLAMLTTGGSAVILLLLCGFARAPRGKTHTVNRQVPCCRRRILLGTQATTYVVLLRSTMLPQAHPHSMFGNAKRTHAQEEQGG
jgi:hypothetical protein